MNRHDRRAARATSAFADLAMEWPQIDANRVGERRGEVVVALCKHDAGCPSLTGAGLRGCCQCRPRITFYVEPTLQ